MKVMIGLTYIVFIALNTSKFQVKIISTVYEHRYNQRCSLSQYFKPILQLKPIVQLKPKESRYVISIQ